jgi:hypothetical protein
MALTPIQVRPMAAKKSEWDSVAQAMQMANMVVGAANGATDLAKKYGAGATAAPIEPKGPVSNAPPEYDPPPMGPVQPGANPMKNMALSRGYNRYAMPQL